MMTLFLTYSTTNLSIVISYPKYPLSSWSIVSKYRLMMCSVSLLIVTIAGIAPSSMPIVVLLVAILLLVIGLKLRFMWVTSFIWTHTQTLTLSSDLIAVITCFLATHSLACVGVIFVTSSHSLPIIDYFVSKPVQPYLTTRSISCILSSIKHSPLITCLCQPSASTLFCLYVHLCPHSYVGSISLFDVNVISFLKNIQQTY